MIVCCGEAVIDMLPRQLADGAEVFHPVVGGSIFNTSIALSRLGVRAGFFSGLSHDFFGSQLIVALKASGVSLAYVKIWDRPSTLAFVKLEGGHASYCFYDENSASRMLSLSDLPKLSAQVKALHFGSISLIDEPGATTLETLLLKEAKRRVISLDPNIRPSVVKNRKAYVARLNRLIPSCDIVKISEEDVAWLMPTQDLQRAAKVWLQRGVKLVVITRGGEGVEAYTAQDHLTVAAQKIEVVDTVGAGDTFTAGLLVALSRARVLNKKSLRALKPEALRKALQFASQAAAITCSRPGADPPWAKEMIESFSSAP